MAEEVSSARPDDPPRRAAEYVRMSTEHQQYSTENQARIIQEYAQHRGFEIVRTYADEGRSGLRILIGWRSTAAELSCGHYDYSSLSVMPEQPLYHHYLPSFYQARWTGSNGKLLRYSRPYADKLVKKWVSPKVSGGEDYLYSDPLALVDEANTVETNFMSPLDSLASDALMALETNDPQIRQNAKLRSAWSRFLLSLMMRMPDHQDTLELGLTEEWALRMPELEIAYAEKRQPDDPPTFSDFMKSRPSGDTRSRMISILPSLVDHASIGDLLNNMRWFIRRIDGNAMFLTSDRPIVTWYEFGTPDSYLILPIGPKAAFCAVNTLETQRRIEAQEPGQWVEGLNRAIVGAAVKYVFVYDDSLTSFIRKNFGKRPRPTLFDLLVRFRRKKNQAQDLLSKT